MSLILCLSSILLGWYCQKSLAKSGGFRKNIKSGDGHIGGLSTEKQGPKFHTLAITIYCYYNLDPGGNDNKIVKNFSVQKYEINFLLKIEDFREKKKVLWYINSGI